MKERIKKLRKEKGITQAELGEILGVGQKSISMIEKGICNPTTSQVIGMSNYFGVSADYILTGNETAKDIEPIEQEILKTIRDDKTLYGALIKILDSKKTVIERFESVAA